MCAHELHIAHHYTGIQDKLAIVYSNFYTLLFSAVGHGQCRLSALLIITLSFRLQSRSLRGECTCGEGKGLQMEDESNERGLKYTRRGRKRERFPNYLGRVDPMYACAVREWE